MLPSKLMRVSIVIVILH